MIIMNIADFAASHNAQPYEVAAFLGLGRDYHDDTELTAEQIAILDETWVDEES